MAVISSQTDSVMVLEVQTGLTPAGGPILSSRSINVKAAATDQDIFDVGLQHFGYVILPILLAFLCGQLRYLTYISREQQLDELFSLFSPIFYKFKAFIRNTKVFLS